jgi:hypothetical protein
VEQVIAYLESEQSQLGFRSQADSHIVPRRRHHPRKQAKTVGCPAGIKLRNSQISSIYIVKQLDKQLKDNKIQMLVAKCAFKWLYLTRKRKGGNLY